MTKPSGTEGALAAPLWIRASIDADAFAREQRALGRLWTFVGFVSDLPHDGDWLRAELGGRSIFVQRFGQELRAFENRCAHRFYPLRTADRGNGPVVCRFHHWRYNREGHAVGIPMCKELYGVIPRDLGAKIARLDLDTCGDLIFARTQPERESETLKEFLAEAYPIIETLCSPNGPSERVRQHISANWKFSHQVSLDDYHIVAVHPTTFGKDGYMKPEVANYHRFGRHSALMETTNPDALTEARKACEDGSYRPSHYAIFNLFPNLLIAQFRAAKLFGTDYWYVSVSRYLPTSPSSTIVQARIYRAPFRIEGGRISRWLRPIINRVVLKIVSFYARKIMAEDNAVCEGQQAIAHQVDGEPLLSAQERRIAWFEEAYARALSAEAIEPPPGMAVK